MNIVIIGHVDHGKSTVIGRLLADTGSLPDGKLEAVKDYCKKNSRAFEYAYLLDALKDEQAQGITIDTARCFFKTSLRDYIIIDAKEGIKENSKRHGHIAAMLGIKQLVVLVNKMDLVDFDKEVFDNITEQSKQANWYEGPTVLERHDVAECIFETAKPIVFDLITTLDKTGRFVIVDNYEISGGGIIIGSVDSGDTVLSEHVETREFLWEKSYITQADRIAQNKHESKFIVLTSGNEGNEIVIEQIGELARLFTDSGQIFITSIFNLDDYEIEKLRLLNQPNEIIVVNIGESSFTNFLPNIIVDEDRAVESTLNYLRNQEVILEYYI